MSTDKLVQVEELTTELYGRGSAVSVDYGSGEYTVRCWDRKGQCVNEKTRMTSTAAIGAMLSNLRLAKASKPVETEDDV